MASSSPTARLAVPERFIDGIEAVIHERPVTIRRLTAADGGAFASHVSADLSRLGAHLPWPANTASVDGARAWLAAYEHQSEGRVLAIGAWDEAGQLLGGAVLFHFDPALPTIELGCWVLGAAEGCGLASLCCRELIALAGDAGAVQRVEWRSTPANTRSRGLAEHLGFHYEGTLRSSYVLRGERLDVDVLSLVAAEIETASAGRRGP